MKSGGLFLLGDVLIRKSGRSLEIRDWVIGKLNTVLKDFNP